MVKINIYSKEQVDSKWASILNGYSYVGTQDLAPTNTLDTNGTLAFTFSASDYGGSNYDFIVIATDSTNVAIDSKVESSLTSIWVAVKNCGAPIASQTKFAELQVYRRAKEGSTCRITLIGCTPRGCVRASELPTLGTAGKVLTVNSGATGVEWSDIPKELPTTLGTAGQVLSVNSGATGVEWANVSSKPLNTITADDLIGFFQVSSGKLIVKKDFRIVTTGSNTVRFNTNTIFNTGDFFTLNPTSGSASVYIPLGTNYCSSTSSFPGNEYIQIEINSSNSITSVQPKYCYKSSTSNLQTNTLGRRTNETASTQTTYTIYI